MAKYRIKDNQTGRSVVVSGDAPPTDTDAEVIFKQAGIRETPQQEKTLGGFAQNVASSAGNTIGGIASAATNVFNPNIEQNTVANVLRLPIGVGEKIGAAVKGDTTYQSGNTQRVDNLVNFYKDRYGGKDQIVNTFYNDPVGALLDLSSVLSAGAGVAGSAGKVSKVNALTNVGKTLDRAADVVNPITQTVKASSSIINNPITRKLEAPFKSSYNAQVDDLYKSMGIDAPVSAVTDSKVVKGAEALVERGTLFGGAITKKLAKARQRIDSLSEELVRNNVRDPDFKTVGEVIKKGFDEYTNEFHSTKTSMYDAVSPQVAKAPANFEKTISAIDEIIARKKDSLSPANLKLYTDLKKRIAGLENPTFSNLKQTRTDIGSKISNFNDPVATGDKASLNQLYSALSDDMDATVKAYDPAAAQAIDEANAFYREGVTKLNSNVGRKILNSDPEKLVNDLVRPNSQTSIAQVKEIVGPEAMQRIQESQLSKLFKDAVNKDGVIDPAKLETQLNKYGEPTLKELFTEEQYKNLTDVMSEAKKYKSMRSGLRNPSSEGSQTAFLMGQASILPLILTNPLYFVKIIGGQYAASKLFTSQAGRKFLTEGYNVAQPSARMIQGAAPQAGKYAQIINLLQQVQGQQ